MFVLFILVSVSIGAPMRQGGRMGMLSQMRCQSLYIHLAMDVRKGLGSVAVDNAALSTSRRGIGLQTGGGFDKPCGLWLMGLDE